MGVTAITNTVVNKRFPNGTEWTLGTADILTSTLVGSFVKIKDNFYFLSGAGVYISETGIDWRLWALSDKRITALHFYKDIWIAGTTTGIYYSYDGIDWTIAQNTVGNNISEEIDFIGFNNGVFSTGRYYSVDGKTWERCVYGVPTPDIRFKNYNCIVNGKWVVSCGSSSGGRGDHKWSDDGITWKSFPSNLLTHQIPGISSLIYNDGIYIMAQANERHVYSYDFETWETVNAPANAIALGYINGIFVAGTTTIPMYSTDGINWLRCTTYPASIGGRYAINGPSIVLMRNRNTARLPIATYTTNGTEWNAVTGGATTALIDIDYFDGMWIARSGTSFYYSICWQPT